MNKNDPEKEYEHSPLTQARSHLEKQTERGDHSPKISGHETQEHGGRLSALEDDDE